MRPDIFISTLLIFPLFCSCIDDDDDVDTSSSEETENQTVSTTDDTSYASDYYTLNISKIEALPQGLMLIKGTYDKNKNDASLYTKDTVKLSVSMGENNNADNFLSPEDLGLDTYLDSDTAFRFIASGLTNGQTYYFQVSAKSTNYGTITSDVLSVEVPLMEIDETYEMEAVDLGLSVKWATKNIGATDAYDIGIYFSFGDHNDSKRIFTEDTYIFQDYEELLPSDISGSEHYDIATILCGDGWRLPTVDECTELSKLHSFKLAKDDDDNLIFVITGTNDETMTLPFGGYKSGLSIVHYPSQPTYLYGCFMTSSPSRFLNSIAYGNSTSSSFGLSVPKNGEPYLGYNIRPVHD